MWQLADCVSDAMAFVCVSMVFVRVSMVFGYVSMMFGHMSMVLFVYLWCLVTCL